MSDDPKGQSSNFGPSHDPAFPPDPPASAGPGYALREQAGAESPRPEQPIATSERRDLSLDEIVARLPHTHRAKREFLDLLNDSILAGDMRRLFGVKPRDPRQELPLPQMGSILGGAPSLRDAANAGAGAWAGQPRGINGREGFTEGLRQLNIAFAHVPAPDRAAILYRTLTQIHGKILGV